MAEKQKTPEFVAVKLTNNMRLKANEQGEFDDRAGKPIRECGLGSVITGVPHNLARELETAGKLEILPEGKHEAGIKPLARRPRSGRIPEEGKGPAAPDSKGPGKK